MAIGTIRWEDVSIDEFVDNMVSRGDGETAVVADQRYFMATFMGRIFPTDTHHTKERFNPMLTLHAVGGSLEEVKQELTKVAEKQDLVFR